MNRRTAMKGLGVLVGVGAIGSALGGDDGDDTDDPDANGEDDTNAGNGDDTSETSTDEPTEEEETDASDDGEENGDDTSREESVSVGERVDGQQLSMVVRDVRTTDKIGEFQEADDGNEFVVVRLAVKNTSDEFIAFSGFLQTRLKDDEDYTYDQTVATTGETMTGGQIAPGEVERGDVVYEVPEDASGLTLQFDFETYDLFEFERVVVDLEQEADAIADFEQTLQVDIHDLEDTVSYDGVSVTVNDVRVEDELGDFAEPDDGNEYVVVDITTENNTGEEQRISTLLQMFLKDGTGMTHQEDLMATSQLDRAYDEGTALADEESRRGELAYEVEAGRSPLYWVFEFTVWVDGDKTFWQLR